MMKKRTLILSCIMVLVVIILFFAVKISTYDNSMSQCEHYQNAQNQQKNIKNNLEE